MLTNDQLVELYGGLPLRATVRAEGEDDGGWFIETPCLFVGGTEPVGVYIQGGMHSQPEQLSHKVLGFAKEGFPVACIGQTGAAGVRKSSNFYDRSDYSRFVKRELTVLDVLEDAFGIAKVIAYGSSIGAAAAIALAAEAPKKVAAVIAVSPASLIKQNPWLMALRFFLSGFDGKADFKPPPRKPPSPIELVREFFGKARELSASDVGLQYLARVTCPVLIYTGRQDKVFPARALKPLEKQFPTVVRVSVLDNFVHSDPNTREKMNRLVTDALERI